MTTTQAPAPCTHQTTHQNEAGWFCSRCGAAATPTRAGVTTTGTNPLPLTRAQRLAVQRSRTRTLVGDRMVTTRNADGAVLEDRPATAVEMGTNLRPGTPYAAKGGAA